MFLLFTGKNLKVIGGILRALMTVKIGTNFLEKNMKTCIRNPKIYSTLTPKIPNSEIYRKGKSIRGHRYIRIKTSAGCDSGNSNPIL